MAQDPKPDEAGSPEPKSKKKLIMIIAIVLILAAGGGGAAWFFLGHKEPAGAKKEAKHEEPAKEPVFLTLETFTVNLQPDPDEKFLQLDMSLQVASAEVGESLKVQMPAVRNRLLFLLSSKKASEVTTMEGKKTLSEEILAELKKPFTPGGKPQEILGVFFTSFVVQ